MTLWLAEVLIFLVTGPLLTNNYVTHMNPLLQVIQDMLFNVKKNPNWVETDQENQNYIAESIAQEQAFKNMPYPEKYDQFPLSNNVEDRRDDPPTDWQKDDLVQRQIFGGAIDTQQRLRGKALPNEVNRIRWWQDR